MAISMTRDDDDACGNDVIVVFDEGDDSCDDVDS